MENLRCFCGRLKKSQNSISICGDCCQGLLSMNNEQVQVLRTGCIEKGRDGKVEILDKVLTEEK